MNINHRFCLKFSENRGQLLVFSLPQTNHYQQISDVKINPPVSKIITDIQWGNKTLVFRLNDVQKNIIIQFKHHPRLINKIIVKNRQITDYQPRLSKFRFYFKPNLFVNGQDPHVIRLSKKIIGKEINLNRIIKKLYDFSLDYLTYGKPIKGLYSYKQAMKERTTDCGGFSTFLASLLQSVNVPSRLVIGYLIKKNIIKKLNSMFHVPCYMLNDLIMHAWLEVLLPNQSWFPLDPAIEWRRINNQTKRQGGFGLIPADRLVTSFGCDFKIIIEENDFQIDLLQQPIYL